MANLDDVMSRIVLAQLRDGSRGSVLDGREAHSTLAAYIRESNIPEPYREILTFMHQAIADGEDAREACAVAAKPGRFSEARRNFAIWQAVNDLAFEDGVTWGRAASKLHSNSAVFRRLKARYPDLDLPPGLETLKNIYRDVAKAATNKA